MKIHTKSAGIKPFPASQAVTIGENRKTHEVTYVYRLAGPDPYEVTIDRMAYDERSGRVISSK